MRTANKPTLKTNELTGIKTLILGCVGVLNGIAEMFPEHTRNYGTVTGQVPATTGKRGRPKANVSTINGKKAA